MFKLIKLAFYIVAFWGIILISVNGHIWYKTGQWGKLSALEALSYISGKNIELPKADPSLLKKIAK
jgi:hypothetical protein